MIPAVEWSTAPRCRIDGRAAWVDGAWVVVWRDGARREDPEPTNPEGFAPYLVDSPADAWRGTAGALLATLAPFAGAHCERCADTAEVPCGRCRGASSGCRECDRTGSEWCACRPSETAIVRIRGREYAGRLLRVLRGILHHAGAEAPCALWTIGTAATEQRHATAALMVDVDGIRFVGASLSPASGVPEVAL